MKLNSWNEIYNIVSDVKFRKNEYYTMMANKLGIAQPQYLQYEKSMKETVISNAKSKIKI